MWGNHSRRRRPARKSGLLLIAALGLVVGAPLAAWAQQALSPEQIQRQREDAERRKLEYLDQKRKVDHINGRVREYKDLMASVPFELVPGTSNMVQVYVNGHNIHEVARRLYFLSDGATDAGFDGYYWPFVLYLNQAVKYEGGLPQYGKLDPQKPETNVAVFPNVRKHEYIAVVANMASQDSALALQLTMPVLAAYRQRLQDEVARLSSRAGEVDYIAGPETAPDELRIALFPNLPTEPKQQFPPRRVSGPTQLASNEPVPVDRAVPLDPAPPAWALRQGVNMLGPGYEGYNMRYTPEHVDLQPEFGPIAFMGGRDPAGNARTQPGMTFGLSQRVFSFLLLNESAFVVFSAGDAPAVNGLNLSTGLDVDLLGLNAAGFVGITTLRVVGQTATGPSFGGKLRYPISDHVSFGVLGRFSNIERFRVEERDASGNLVAARSGVTRASYAGITFTLR